MNNYIEDLTTIISDCSMENTYKMSWSRALVEHAYNYPHKKEIHFDRISELMFKYYWDQTIFFNLEQGSNLKKKPTIIQIVNSEIEKPKLSMACFMAVSTSLAITCSPKAEI